MTALEARDPFTALLGTARGSGRDSAREPVLAVNLTSLPGLLTQLDACRSALTGPRGTDVTIALSSLFSDWTRRRWSANADILLDNLDLPPLQGEQRADFRAHLDRRLQRLFVDFAGDWSADEASACAQLDGAALMALAELRARLAVSDPKSTIALVLSNRGGWRASKEHLRSMHNLRFPGRRLRAVELGGWLNVWRATFNVPSDCPLNPETFGERSELTRMRDRFARALAAEAAR